MTIAEAGKYSVTWPPRRGNVIAGIHGPGG